MSTNYYVKRKPTLAEKDNISNLIESGLFKKASKELQQFPFEPIHLGKSSGGWRFLFNANEFRYYHDLDSLFKFLQTVSIIDEYDQEWTYQELMELVDINKNEKSHESPVLSPNFSNIDGLEFLNCEFC